PIVLMGEVIVMCHIAPRRATRSTLATQKCLQRPNDSVARHAALVQPVAPQELEQIPERPALDGQRAVHIKFAEIKVRMQRELQRGKRALDAYGYIRLRLCGCQFAELFRVAVGSNDRQSAVPDQLPEGLSKH